MKLNPPLPDPQQYFIEHALDTAAQIMAEKGEVRPVLLGVSKEQPDNLIISPLPIPESGEKRQFFWDKLRMVQQNLLFSATVMECWMVLAKSMKDAKLEIPPSQHPDKFEVVQVAFRSNDPDRLLVFNAETKRNPNGLGEWRLAHDSISHLNLLQGRQFTAANAN